MSNQLPLLGRELTGAVPRPEKIIQFGTGNFLKGFINWIVQQLNQKTDLDAGIVAVKLRAGNEAQIDEINAQQGLFTVNVRGLDNGELVDEFELIDCQNRALSPYRDHAAYGQLAELPDLQWVVSNTTEAGIQYNPSDRLNDEPAQSFPAKLTQLLYRRFKHFDGDNSKGLRIFCCELIDNNAYVLRDLLLRYATNWQLEQAFSDWLHDSCYFCNTLVDRIVTGKPSAERSAEIQQQLGYIDNELIETERYYQWVIEVAPGDEAEMDRLFPAATGLNIVLVPDLNLYRQRKVRILNGAHTGCVSLARLLDIETVYQGTQDADLNAFMQRLVYEEICPTIALPREEVTAYADAIIERFGNPFLHHEWQSIGLNSLSKWRARLLPVLHDTQSANGAVPPAMVTSLACLLLVYRGEYQGRAIQLQDDPGGLELMQRAWQKAPQLQAVVQTALSAQDIWGEDLSGNRALVAALVERLSSIQSQGLRSFLQNGVE